MTRPAGIRDPCFVPALRCQQDRESVYDNMCESWVLSRSAPLEQQVAGLRLVLACLSGWGFQYPLTEDRCMDQLLVG
jgi:HIV-1 Vpr-binding protein